MVTKIRFKPISSWSSAPSRGISLEKATQASARRSIKQTTKETSRTAKPLVNRVKAPTQTPTDFPRPRSFHQTASAGTRPLSTSHDRNTGVIQRGNYFEAEPREKVLILIYNALRKMGVDLPSQVVLTPMNIEKSWKKAQSKYSHFPGYDSANPANSLAFLVRIMPSYNPKVQSSPIIEDVNEALILEKFDQQSTEAIILPFSESATEDSKAGELLLRRLIQPNSTIIEDGCNNGQDLISLALNLQKRNIPVQALGFDIAFYNTNIARMLSASLGIEEFCDFYAANALHRRGSREIFGNKGPHIIMGYRLIPVFDEGKILRYMGGLRNEMSSGDLWCGSIALPEGKLYERNTTDQEMIKKHSIRAIPTTFGGITFVERPDLGATDSQLVPYFNKKYKEFNIKFKKRGFFKCYSQYLYDSRTI
jgi:hypothetical protein